MSDEELNRLVEEAKKRPKLSWLYSDFMDALSDYGCGLYTSVEFRKILEDINNRYKHYPTTEIMYKAMIQRLTSCSHITRKEDGIGRTLAELKSTEAKTQIEWIDEELDTLKRPPKIIF